VSADSRTTWEKLGGNPTDVTTTGKNPTDGIDGIDVYTEVKSYRPSDSPEAAGKPRLRGLLFPSSQDGKERKRFILWSVENYPRPQKRKGKRQGNQLFGLARLIKFHPASPFKSVAHEDILGEYLTYIPEYLESDGFAENFIAALEAVKIPLDYHPVKDAITAVATKPLIQFPSKRAKTLRRYNIFLNMLVHLRKLIPADEDLFLSCNAISKIFVAAGFKLSPYLVAAYINWAMADGYLVRTKEHNYVKAARYRFTGGRVVLRFQIEALTRRIEALEQKRKQKRATVAPIATV
jgi:hypothetical protein